MSSPEVRRLTLAHKLAQSRIAAGTLRHMLAIWPLLDPTNLDSSSRRWLTAALPVIAAQRAASTQMATDYLTQSRVLQIGSDALPTIPPPTFDRTAVTTSLVVTGPYAIKAAMARGEVLASAMDTAQATSAAAAMRHTLNAGRETIISTVQADPRGTGWERVASDNACDFCLELVDWSDGNAALRSDFQAHDGCNCTAEPGFA